MNTECAVCGKALTLSNIRWVIYYGVDGKEEGGYAVGSECAKKVQLPANAKIVKGRA